MDRLLGFLAALVVAVLGFFLVTHFTFSWVWVFSVSVTTGLALWVGSGLRKIEIGFRGQLLCIGQRVRGDVGEGWRWAPFPFSLLPVDCRQKILELDVLEVITADNVEVTVGATVTYRVTNLFLFLGLEEAGLKRGIDDTRDTLIRSRVREMSLEEVLGSNRELGNLLIGALPPEVENWGVRILGVVIPKIRPTSEKVRDDLELRRRELLQRAGQAVEVAFASTIVDLLVRGGTIRPDGTVVPRGDPIPADAIVIPGGMTREQAQEHMQLALSRATKTIDAKTFVVDQGNLAAIVAAIIGRATP